MQFLGRVLPTVAKALGLSKSEDGAASGAAPPAGRRQDARSFFSLSLYYLVDLGATPRLWGSTSGVHGWGHMKGPRRSVFFPRYSSSIFHHKKCRAAFNCYPRNTRPDIENVSVSREMRVQKPQAMVVRLCARLPAESRLPISLGVYSCTLHNIRPREQTMERSTYQMFFLSTTTPQHPLSKTNDGKTRLSLPNKYTSWEV